MKRSQWILRTVLAGALTLGGASFAFANTPVQGTFNASEVVNPATMQTTLDITGQASKTMAPTYAVVSLGLTNQGSTVQEAKNKNDLVMNTILSRVKELGIPSKNIQTQDLQVNPMTDYQKTPHKTIGYEMSNVVVIRVDELGKVSRVIDAALAAGATQLNSLSFSADISQTTNDELIQSAIADATHTAHIVAQSLGKKVVGVETIHVNGSSVASNSRPRFRAYALAAESATPVEQGSVTAQQSVSMKFILQ